MANLLTFPRLLCSASLLLAPELQAIRARCVQAWALFALENGAEALHDALLPSLSANDECKVRVIDLVFAAFSATYCKLAAPILRSIPVSSVPALVNEWKREVGVIPHLIPHLDDAPLYALLCAASSSTQHDFITQYGVLRALSLEQAMGISHPNSNEKWHSTLSYRVITISLTSDMLRVVLPYAECRLYDIFSNGPVILSTHIAQVLSKLSTATIITVVSTSLARALPSSSATAALTRLLLSPALFNALVDSSIFVDKLGGVLSLPALIGAIRSPSFIINTHNIDTILCLRMSLSSCDQLDHQISSNCDAITSLHVLQHCLLDTGLHHDARLFESVVSVVPDLQAAMSDTLCAILAQDCVSDTRGCDAIVGTLEGLASCTNSDVIQALHCCSNILPILSTLIVSSSIKIVRDAATVLLAAHVQRTTLHPSQILSLLTIIPSTLCEAPRILHLLDKLLTDAQLSTDDTHDFLCSIWDSTLSTLHDQSSERTGSQFNAAVEAILLVIKKRGSSMLNFVCNNFLLRPSSRARPLAYRLLRRLFDLCNHSESTLWKTPPSAQIVSNWLSFCPLQNSMFSTLDYECASLALYFISSAINSIEFSPALTHTILDWVCHQALDSTDCILRNAAQSVTLHFIRKHGPDDITRLLRARHFKTVLSTADRVSQQLLHDSARVLGISLKAV